MIKKIIWSIVIIILLFALVSMFLVFDWGRSSRHFAVDFKDCVMSGFAVMESYPRQCRDGANKTFIEDIGNTLAKADLISLDYPKPNDEIRSGVHLSGKARGPWFFEASFPVKLKNVEGKILGTAIATAKTDWMTGDFVEFSADLFFNVSTTTRATIELIKDNPSGRKDLDELLIIPIVLLPATSSAQTI